MCFIVRAYSPVEAAILVEDAWVNIPNRYTPFAVAAIEFQISPFHSEPMGISEAIKNGILFYDKSKDNYIYWRRDETNEPWMSVNGLHKGNIVYFKPE
ncbi:MAG: hypothetical protein HRU05_11780 [Oceanospirillaceae bacterium]|nr:hypothetical protein [Oceanospirillaceae bacterium]